MSSLAKPLLSKQLKAFKFRLYPNKAQKIYFSKCFGCARFIYNKMLSDKIDYYQQYKKMLKVTPAMYKQEFAWLKEVDSLALSNAQLNLEQAYQYFFKNNSGFPNYKKKCNHQTYTTNNQKGSIKIEGNKIKLPKIGWVKAKVHRKVDGLIKSATISINASGTYEISVLAQTNFIALEQTDRMLGIDLGLLDLATFSDGSVIANIKVLQEYETKIKKLQRKLAKKREQAKKDGRRLSDCQNYQKDSKKLAKLYEKVKHTRNDYLNKVTTSIIKNHDIIVIETLSSKNLMKNHKLAKAFGDVAWYAFVSKLEYKCQWYGKELIKISKWYPSSQICAYCGHHDGKKNLSIRVWQCPKCQSILDRDINAATNILIEGLRSHNIDKLDKGITIYS